VKQPLLGNSSVDQLPLQDSAPCSGGVEYLHRDPASRRRRRKEKSRTWDSKMWSWVRQDWDMRMAALAMASSNCKRQTIVSSERMLHKDYNDKCSVKKILVVSLKRLVTKTNWLTVNRQSWSNSDSDLGDSLETAVRRVEVGVRWPGRLSQLRVAVARSEKLVAEAWYSSGTQREGKVHHWKPLPSNGYWRLRRLYVCCSYSDLWCNSARKLSNKSDYQSKPSR
jgi:hypothetical protein